MQVSIAKKAPLTKFCSNTTFFWRQSRLANLFSWQQYKSSQTLHTKNGNFKSVIRWWQ